MLGNKMTMRIETLKKQGARFGHFDAARPDDGDGEKLRLNAQ